MPRAEYASTASCSIASRIVYLSSFGAGTITDFPAEIAELVLYYFATLREGLWYATPTAADLLGRAPRSYGDWLTDHPQRTLSQTAASEV